MSNFDFLKDFDEDLWKCGNRIEEQINKYPFGVHSEATAFLEHILKNLRFSIGLPKSKKNFYDRLDEAYRTDNKKIPYKYKDLIYSAYQERNRIHADLSDIEKDQYVIALNIHKKLYYIARKYFEIMGGKKDELRGIPPYKAPELDFSPEELELIEIPDFNDIIDVKYDYCVVCGEPNHDSYSIYCQNCNNHIDNANNFISIRNHFGKDATLTKEKLIEYGIPEANVNSLMSHLTKSDLFKVKGRNIEFNNSKMDSYLREVDRYIRVGELLTQFRHDLITPAEIRQTSEYKTGSYSEKNTFHHFYRVINEEIINKFEKELLSTEDIKKSIEYTTITSKELNRWYNIQLNLYRKDNSSEAFELFNKLMIDEYLSLKREGLKEDEISKNLNISHEMLEFFPKFRDDFDDEISKIKKDLILKALSENKSKSEAIDFAGITQKEYDDIIKYSRFKQNEFSKDYERILNERKETLLFNLTDNDLIKSCEMTKITVNDFYDWYDKADLNSDFYIKSTKILMKKFLDERKTGKTKLQAADAIYLKENIVNYWLKRKDKLFDKFQDDNLKVTVDLILEGFKNNKTISEIIKEVEVTPRKINTFLDLGRRQSKIYVELYEYYENEVIPRNLSKFLAEIKNKSLNKALRLSDLTMDELNYYYENDEEFHNKFLALKMDKYIEEILDGRSHVTSINRSYLTQDEYNQLKDEIDEIILKERMKIVKREIANDSKTDLAAKRAGVTFDDVYGWYYKGKSDEKYREFSEFFYNHYIETNVLLVNRLIRDGKSIESIVNSSKDNFTKKDFEMWQKEGLIKKENSYIDLTEDDTEEGISLFDSYNYGETPSENYLPKGIKNSNLYSRMNKDKDEEIRMKDVVFKQKKHSKSSTIIKKYEKDEEKLKKEILGKK